MTKTLKICFVLIILNVFSAFFTSSVIFAEYKSDVPSGQNIPKLEVTPNDPRLINGHVYPNWGPVCQRYTYSVIYLDDQGRPPEYIKMYFNGAMLDMVKENLEDDDYSRGVKYIYTFVPNKLGSNFFFFEASNGLGKTRSNIIDSPDNGPVLFKNAFDKNEVAVIDYQTQTKILSYDLHDEWVGGVALSDDGKYLAVKTHKKIYLFDTSKPNEPIWTYEKTSESVGDVKGGVDISGDGTRIIASIGGEAILFANQTNKPIWIYQGTRNQAYNVAISKDGKYMAMGTAGSVSSTAQGYKSSETTNLLILWSDKSNVPLWQYHTEGNFHDVSLSDNGSYVTGATGCPDRRFYLFSKDSNEPIIRSEMLTRDSPVHRAKISGDGQYAAVGSESGDGAVFLFSKDSSKPIWKTPMPNSSSARALNFSSDGEYIGAATFGGDVYIFNRSSSTPVSHWKVSNTSLGGIDIAEDGSYVAVGGTDSQLHIFKRSSAEHYSVEFNEYVEEIDISANGKYIAAGTGGSVYFFEAFDNNTQAVVCKEIKEPPIENINRQGQNTQMNKNISSDTKKVLWPSLLFGFGFITSFLSLAVYFIVTRFNLISEIKTKIFKRTVVIAGPEILHAKDKVNKRIMMILATSGIIFLLLTAVTFIINNMQENSRGINLENSNLLDKDQQNGCGDGICEPNFGETNTNCPNDCSESSAP